jgi:hypothetical protein
MDKRTKQTKSLSDIRHCHRENRANKNLNQNKTLFHSRSGLPRPCPKKETVTNCGRQRLDARIATLMDISDFFRG